MRRLFLVLALLVGCPSAPDETPVVSDDDDSAPATGEGPLLFRLPLSEPWMFDPQVIGFDHDPEDHGDDGPLGGAICTNHAGEGFPDCYDGHDATDIILDGGFPTMDAGSSPVVAAAAGTVISVEESQYDRCHVEGTGVSCDGYPMIANHVILDHGEGITTRYWHLKTDSVVVEVGDVVECGQTLALVGSSGNSSMPHLHFGVRRDDEPFDPYAGVASQPESYWTEQDGPLGLPGQACADWTYVP